jgi:hypothetical protein
MHLRIRREVPKSLSRNCLTLLGLQSQQQTQIYAGMKTSNHQSKHNPPSPPIVILDGYVLKMGIAKAFCSSDSTSTLPAAQLGTGQTLALYNCKNSIILHPCPLSSIHCLQNIHGYSARHHRGSRFYQNTVSLG